MAFLSFALSLVRGSDQGSAVSSRLLGLRQDTERSGKTSLSFYVQKSAESSESSPLFLCLSPPQDPTKVRSDFWERLERMLQVLAQVLRVLEGHATH